MRDTTVMGLTQRDSQYLQNFADNPYQPEHAREIARAELERRATADAHAAAFYAQLNAQRRDATWGVR